MSNNKVTITLERGPSGLGFNIKGGFDAQIFDGDSGIYVAKIKPEGAAAKDKRLGVGDKIIEVNNIPLVNVTHQFAVDTFVNAGDTVTMVVLPNEEALVEQRQASRHVKPPKSSGGWSTSATVVGTVAIAACATGVMWYLRHQK